MKLNRWKFVLWLLFPSEKTSYKIEKILIEKRCKIYEKIVHKFSFVEQAPTQNGDKYELINVFVQKMNEKSFH